MRGLNHNGNTRLERRGAVLVQLAILLVVMTMFIALAVDICVIATARAQLKTVADAAALAGARQLASERRLSRTITNLTTEINSARTYAISAGNANLVLGASPQLTADSILVGYKKVRAPSADLPDSAVDTTVAESLYNSVQVTASVTVPALFSAPFRPGGSTVSVTSTATVEPVGITGFNIGTSNASILPIVMDGAAYSRMMNGTGGDSYSFSSSSYNPPSTNGVSNGSDGITESVAYPVTTNLSGNWGTIKFGVSNNSTSTLGTQISSGVTPAQMSAEYPGSTTVTVPHTFGANPGISAGIKNDLTAIIGKPVTVPIYSSSGGNGNNAWYNATAFASVRIVAVNLTGNPKYVVVQPALNVDSSAILDTSSPNSWSGGGGVFLRLSR